MSQFRLMTTMPNQHQLISLPPGIKILYWNARSFRKRKNEIRNILNQIDILVCVESWLDSSIVNLHYPGFVNYRTIRSYSTGGGILILIRLFISL